MVLFRVQYEAGRHLLADGHRVDPMQRSRNEFLGVASLAGCQSYIVCADINEKARIA